MELPLAHVEIDGTRLSEWQLSSGLSRSTMYELLKLLKIRPEGRRVATSRKLVSYLSADQVQLLEQWSAAIKKGATLPQIRERIGSSEIVSVVNPILSEIIPGSSQTVQDGDLASKLEAAGLAVSSGLGLTTIGSSEIVSVVNPILSETIPGSSQTVQDGDLASELEAAELAVSDLASRLEAAGLAVSSGLGLTTKEVAWILGVNPGGAFFSRGGITCTKTGKNCWLLASRKVRFF